MVNKHPVELFLLLFMLILPSFWVLTALQSLSVSLVITCEAFTHAASSQLILYCLACLHKITETNSLWNYCARWKEVIPSGLRPVGKMLQRGDCTQCLQNGASGTQRTNSMTRQKITHISCIQGIKQGHFLTMCHMFCLLITLFSYMNSGKCPGSWIFQSTSFTSDERSWRLSRSDAFTTTGNVPQH